MLPRLRSVSGHGVQSATRPGRGRGADWVNRRSGLVEKPQTQVQVDLGEREAEGIYSNLVFIAHSASEVILDFARALPGLPKPKVYARVILTPQHARALLAALEQNLKQYESQFGPIKLPGEPGKGKELGFHA
uniref:DUF3467 domain-containing protein n=1 Tax=Eiseniibacteriota bacterium TaxID=2212470 RepID=A0A832MJK9_UNCEI